MLEACVNNCISLLCRLKVGVTLYSVISEPNSEKRWNLGLKGEPPSLHFLRGDKPKPYLLGVSKTALFLFSKESWILDVEGNSQ